MLEGMTMGLVPRKDPEERIIQRSVGLPKWMWRLVEEEAERAGRSQSEIVRFLLERHFKKPKPRG